MTTVEQQPQPPCTAYQLVARHVPETYYWKPPPPTGVKLTAVSNMDCTGSEWRLPDWLAREIAVHLAPLRGVSIFLATYGLEVE